jgi:hypothetical protein
MKRLLLALAVAGCATEPVPTSQAAPVPPSRFYAQHLSAKGPNTGAVIIKRDSGLAAAACAVGVYLNGNLVADLRTSEMVLLHLPAGEHIAGTRSSGICFSGNSESQVIVRSGETRTYRISIDTGGTSRISPTAF